MTQIVKLSNQLPVCPGCDVTFTTKLSPGFRLRRLIIPGEIAEHFLLTSLAFGKNNQMMSPGAVPAILFSDNANPQSYDFDPNPENDEIKISVTNQSDKTIMFVAAAFGDDSPDAKVNHTNFIGLGNTSVPSGQGANICVQPAQKFQGRRLVVPSTIGSDFSITGIKVGHHDQFRDNTPPIPAFLFSETRVPETNDLNLDTCHESVFLTLSVLNTSRDTKNFSAALTGLFRDRE
jgi:hypothetical protein